MPKRKRRYYSKKKKPTSLLSFKKLSLKYKKIDLSKPFFFIGLVFVSVSLLYKLNNLVGEFIFSSHNAQIACREEKSLPSTLTIPAISARLPIEESFIRGGEWEISKKGVSHLNNSARPGASGNVVVYGHNTVRQLGNLANLKEGDYIILQTKNGDLYPYVVASKKTVSPSETSILNSNGSEVLTIYTCIGFADSMRFVVQAKPAKNTFVKSSHASCRS